MLRRLNWLLMLATLGSAFALYAIKYDTRRLEARVAAQERALEKAENDVTILMAERTHLARPERLEPLARLIGLVPIQAAQYLRVELPAGQSVPSPILPAARLRHDVAEERGVRDTRTSHVERPPDPEPSQQLGEEAHTAPARSKALPALAR
jgi:cell division protein FtsL